MSGTPSPWVWVSTHDGGALIYNEIEKLGIANVLPGANAYLDAELISRAPEMFRQLRAIAEIFNGWANGKNPHNPAVAHFALREIGEVLGKPF